MPTDTPVLETMKRLIREQDSCVLATVGPDNRPHCSLMSYVADNDCRTMYMLTSEATRKYRNLTANPQVSLLLDNRGFAPASSAEATLALTISGRCRPLSEGPEKAERTRLLLAHHPHLAPVAAQPDVQLVAVSVEELQLLRGAIQAYHAKMA